MVDERALQAAHRAFVRDDETVSMDIIMRVRPAIDAYEAAKWRPIEEADHDGGLMWLWNTKTCSAGYFERYGQNPGWRWWTGEFPAKQPTMFRTIDPPKQNAVSRGTSTPPAAEASDRFISVHDEISSPDTRRMDQETPRSKS